MSNLNTSILCNLLQTYCENSSNVYMSIITFYSIVGGFIYTYIIFYVGRSFDLRKEKKNKFNRIGQKIVLFQKILYYLYNESKLWVNKHAITDYKNQIQNNN